MKSGTDDLRIAVIGLGVRAYLIQLAHRPGAGSRVVAPCDVDPLALAQHAQALGASNQLFCATDYRRVLELASVDAVLVLTPDHTHEAIVIDALRAGKAVFCDKPLAISSEACDHISSTARATGSRLYVGHNM